MMIMIMIPIVTLMLSITIMMDLDVLNVKMTIIYTGMIIDAEELMRSWITVIEDILNPGEIDSSVIDVKMTII